MNSPEKSDSYADALQVALRYLSFKPRTVAEVRRRVGRDFEQPVVEQALIALKGYGYLDDAEFARQWRNARERRKPRGSSLIRRELRSKGVADTLIEDALVGLDETDAAYRAASRRAQRLLADGAVSYRIFHRRMWDYLQRRGFGSGVTRDTVRRLWAESALATDEGAENVGPDR